MNLSCRGQALVSAAKRSSCGAVCLEHNLLLERTPRWFQSKRVSGDHILSFPGVFICFPLQLFLPLGSSCSLDDAVPSCPVGTGPELSCATQVKSADFYVGFTFIYVYVPERSQFLFASELKGNSRFLWMQSGKGRRMSMIKRPQCQPQEASLLLLPLPSDQDTILGL